MSDIQRFNPTPLRQDGVYKAKEGQYVLFSDHAEAVAEMQDMIAALEHCLNGASKAVYTAEVHDRILAEAVEKERQTCQSTSKSLFVAANFLVKIGGMDELVVSLRKVAVQLADLEAREGAPWLTDNELRNSNLGKMKKDNR